MSIICSRFGIGGLHTIEDLKRYLKLTKTKLAQYLVETCVLEESGMWFRGKSINSFHAPA